MANTPQISPEDIKNLPPGVPFWMPALGGVAAAALAWSSVVGAHGFTEITFIQWWGCVWGMIGGAITAVTAYYTTQMKKKTAPEPIKAPAPAPQPVSQPPLSVSPQTAPLLTK